MSKQSNIRRIMEQAGKEIPKEYDPFLMLCNRDIDPEMYDKIANGDINPVANMINSKEDQARILKLFLSSGAENRKKEAERLNKINHGQQES